MITLTDYWMGRDSQYRGEWTQAVQQAAADLVARVNRLIPRMALSGVTPEISPATGSPVNSGWRPAAVNARVAGAAVRSKHMSGQAIDLYDPEGELDQWCMDHLADLAECGLYLEHPSATKGWCHLQSVPPKSGRQIFYP